jgi:glycosyltransferase involved in cell wall biosynthesis
MKNFTIILPVYNDWESLNILLEQISEKLNRINANFGLLIIDDGSSDQCNFALSKKKFFKKIQILHLNKNIGSQSAIATAIKYIDTEKKVFSKNFIIMDSDGEDDSSKIKEIIDYLTKNDSNIITLNRVIRKESFVFSCLYEIHLLVTFLITFQYIRFGNFSFLNLRTIKKISQKKRSVVSIFCYSKKIF